MTRALWWKELRAQAPLLVAASTIVLILPLFLLAGMLVTTPNYELAALGKMLPAPLLFLVWPIFGAATGAMTVAADRSDGSLHFLLSRPASRTRVWVAKVGAAAAMLILIVVSSGGFALALDYLVSGDFAATLHLNALGWNPAAAMAGPLMVLSVLFASAHYCSLFFRRPLAAALAGGIVAAAMSACVTMAWTVMVPPSRFARDIYFGAGVTTGVPFAGVGLLFAAWWVFSRGEIVEAHAARRMGVPLLLVCVFVILAGAGPSAYFGSRSMASLAAELPVDFRAIDGNAVIADLTPMALGTRLAMIDLRTGDTPIVASRYATAPVLSDDGTLIAYVGLRRLLGAASRDVEVRVVRPDGTDDRVVSSSLPWWWRASGRKILSISPDLEYVAAYNGTHSVLLAPVADGPQRSLRLSQGDGGGPVGWTRGAPSELLYYSFSNRGRSDARTELIAFEPRSAATRVVADFPGRHSLRLYGNSWNGAGWSWHRYPVWVEEEGGERLYLIDTATGEKTPLSDRPCPVWGASADETRIVYGHCSDNSPYLDVELRLRDLTTGSDERFAILEGVGHLSSSRALYLSPDATRVAVHLRRGATWGTYLVHREGSEVGLSVVPVSAVSETRGQVSGGPSARWTSGDGVELVSTSGYPIGWIDERQLIVVNNRLREVDIEVVDIETNSRRKVYTRR